MGITSLFSLMNFSIYLISGCFLIPLNENLSPCFIEFAKTGLNTCIFLGLGAFIIFILSRD